jgi:hypothetical protein
MIGQLMYLREESFGTVAISTNKMDNTAHIGLPLKQYSAFSKTVSRVQLG